MPRPLAFALALALLPAAGCDSAAPCVAGTDPACTPAEPDGVLDGVDLTALFAAPTAAERDSVAARLARTGGTDAPRAVSADVEGLATEPDGTRYQLVTLRDAAGADVLLALARIPPVTGGGTGVDLPTVLLLPDGDGTGADAFLTGERARGLDRAAIQVAVAFRGAGLVVRGAAVAGPEVTFGSSARPDPYRADVLDVLALVARLDVVDRASPTRVAAVGVGRGGAVALLAAERAPGVFAAVAPLGAPTSLFDPSFRASAREALLGLPSALPASEALLAPVFAVRDGQASIAEARLRLLELSAAALADRLPATLAFHGAPDPVVPTSHLARLRDEGDGPPEARRRFVEVFEGAHERLFDRDDVRAELVPFLLERL